MTEVIFNGRFSVKDPDQFISQINKVMKENGITFTGDVLKFDPGYTEYEEIKDEAEQS